MSAKPGPLHILAVSDGEFLPRLRTLASSINRNMPSSPLHAYLVNVDAEEAADIKSIHPLTEFAFVYETLDDAEVKTALDGVTKFTEKAGFCVNLRGRAIQQLLLGGVEYLLFLDADSIVRRDLSGLVEMLDEYDILVHKRERQEEFMRVAAGVIGVRRSARTLDFVARLIKRIEELGDRTFFSDQLAFYLTAFESPSETRIGHLPGEYIDWEFSPDSYIWTGKGQRKHVNQIYRSEESLYGI